MGVGALTPQINYAEYVANAYVGGHIAKCRRPCDKRFCRLLHLVTTPPIGRALNAKSKITNETRELVYARVAPFSSRHNGLPCLLLAALAEASYGETLGL